MIMSTLWTLQIAAILAQAPAPRHDPCAAADDGWIAAKLKADKRFAPLLAAAETHRLQLVITEVARTDGKPRLTTHHYRAGVEYYYPASAIKTFASVAALRELALLKVDREAPVAICRKGQAKCATVRDRSNLEGGKITLGHEIRKMQIVSDNGSFNRLYDFVGHRAMNELAALGFPSLRVGHRLSTRETPAENLVTPAMQLRPKRGEPIDVPARTSDFVLASHGVPGTLVGEAVKIDGAVVAGPKEFEGRNGVALCDLQRLTIALVLPEQGPDLGLAADDRAFLVETMTRDPQASLNPVFRDPAETEERFKPLLPGMVKVLPRTRIRYVNKAGKAYGFHVENAYVEDTKTGRAYFVTATVYANRDGVLDDDRYDYADVSEPFYAHLGELLARTWAE
jgi:hypothetical protein